MRWRQRKRERGQEPRLTVELVPQTCWFSNLRSELLPQDWDRLRRHCYKQARYRCEVCGGRGREHPVECHELWTYDDEVHVQSLAGVIALCPDCHEAKHIGSAGAAGHADRARAHLAEVNHWDSSTLNAYLQHVFDEWQQRSQHAWQLDIEGLYDYGITPPARAAAQRPAMVDPFGEDDDNPTMVVREISLEEALDKLSGR